jgi:hypothetical protein
MLLLLGLAAVGAHAMEADLDGAWRDYAGNRAHLEPAYRFPFAILSASDNSRNRHMLHSPNATTYQADRRRPASRR